MSANNYHFETLQLHAGQETSDLSTGARAVPIYQTAAYVFDDAQMAADRFALQSPGNIYGRLTNPTQDVLERRITALEGGTASLALASGAAAVTYSLLNVLQPGDHIVAGDNLYGGTYNLIVHTLHSLNVEYTIVNLNDANALENSIRPNTKVVFGETLSNPNSDVTNIDKVAEIAHKHNVLVIIDNTFATPFLFQPLKHGADIVVHSATKFIGGHGTSLGGLIVDGGRFDFKANAGKFNTIAQPDPSYHGAVFADCAATAPFVTRVRAVVLRDQGATLSPFNAFLLLQGLETLSLRVERHVENALKVVDYLKKHPKVKSVSHPSIESNPNHSLYNHYFPNGAGCVFTFDINGDRSDAFRFIDSLKVFSLLANVADAKSLIIHPASTTHSQLSEQELTEQHISQSTLRLSIGIEHIDDIINDLDQAFNKL